MTLTRERRSAIALTAIVLAVMAAASAAVAAAESNDPWAPGASIDPWPLIGRLQAWGIGPDAEPDWRAASVHADPLVRAAAAAALGRTPTPARRVHLDPFLRDRVRIVRRAAQWALLQFGGDVPVELVEDAILEPGPRELYQGRSRGSLDPEVHRLLKRFIPATVQYERARERAWLRDQRVLRADLTVADAGADLRGWVAVRRSEWDAAEVVELSVQAAVRSAHPMTIRFDRYLEPSDPYHAPAAPRSSTPPDDAVFVEARVVGGDGTGEATLAPGAASRLQIAFDLGEVPPDVYTLSFGNPLFLRVRRGRAMEERAAAAARDVLTSEDALDRVARLRVLAAAPALRQRFSESLRQYGFGFNAYRDARVLARLPDRASADLVVPALLANRAFRDPWTGDDGLGEILLTGFGGAAADAVVRVATQWREELAASRIDGLARILGDRERTEPAVVRARLEALAELGALLGAGQPYAPEAGGQRDVLSAALAAAAADHPAEAVESLAAVAANKYGPFHHILQSAVATLTNGQAERVLQPLSAVVAGRPEAAAAVATEAAALGLSVAAPPPPP
jgi:hypothetical protein